MNLQMRCGSYAAGPWNHDMSQAPKDGSDLFLLIEINGDRWTDVADWCVDEWRGDGQQYLESEVIAFAEIHIPKIERKDHE